MKKLEKKEKEFVLKHHENNFYMSLLAQKIVTGSLSEKHIVYFEKGIASKPEPGVNGDLTEHSENLEVISFIKEKDKKEYTEFAKSNPTLFPGAGYYSKNGIKIFIIMKKN